MRTTFRWAALTLAAVLGYGVYALYPPQGSATASAPRVTDSQIDRFLSPYRLAYHRGNTDVAQENSLKSLVAALESPHPHIEVDVTTFMSHGKEVGLLAHENKMRRTTGIDGVFQDHDGLENLPPIIMDPRLKPEPFMTVVALFDLIDRYKRDGKAVPIVSLDVKVEENGEPFGKWLGSLIQAYGFEDHVFASSFWNGALDGLKETCSRCLTGAVIFQDHWALQFLPPTYSALDLARATAFSFPPGSRDEKEDHLDFVLIHDEIFFKTPSLADYWREKRGVQFVGIFTQELNAEYTKAQWALIAENEIRWLEVSPRHVEAAMGERL